MSWRFDESLYPGPDHERPTRWILKDNKVVNLDAIDFDTDFHMPQVGEIVYNIDGETPRGVIVDIAPDGKVDIAEAAISTTDPLTITPLGKRLVT